MSSMMFQVVPNQFSWVKYTMIGSQMKNRVASCGGHVVNDIVNDISFLDFY